MSIKRLSVSQFDQRAYKIIRDNICLFLAGGAEKYDSQGKIILDIAPQIHEGAITFFKKGIIKTLDIDVNSGADYISDITKNNSSIIKDNKFDVIICTEVLEHTRNPFAAVDEIYRLLKKRGIVLISVPFNFRIHGPLPDCWRFTEHGLREILKKFTIISLNQIDTEGRNLMPIHYTIIAQK